MGVENSNHGADLVKGTQTTDRSLDQRIRTIGRPSRGRFGSVFLALVLLRRVVRLISGSSNELMNTKVVVVVFRHQLMVLKPQVGKLRLRRGDRAGPAALYLQALGEPGGYA